MSGYNSLNQNLTRVHLRIVIDILRQINLLSDRLIRNLPIDCRLESECLLLSFIISRTTENNTARQSIQCSQGLFFIYIRPFTLKQSLHYPCLQCRSKQYILHYYIQIQIFVLIAIVQWENQSRMYSSQKSLTLAQ